MKRFLPAVALLLLGACKTTIDYTIDPPDDINIAPPSTEKLREWQAVYESGRTWRGDARQVAHRTLLSRLDVIWKYRPYDEDDYQVKNDKPDWGTYVVRGFATRDQNRRYRVKVRKYRDVWYPVQVSHYSAVVLPHPALEDDD